MRLNRRNAIAGAAATAVFAPAILRAQGEPIRIAALNPLTGAGGSYGPSMRKAIESVVNAVNEAGGVKGRKVQLAGEDSQTNPDAAVRAARKLIDVDKVCAVMGTWASAVTTAVAPVCWESKVFLTTVSGSDTITHLPHQGYLVRTQPTSTLQMRKMAEYTLGLGAKRMFIISAQTPFAIPSQELLTEHYKKAGKEVVGTLIYDKDKTTFRSECDAIVKAKPDMVYLNGYTPDVTVVVKDLFRAGYTGNRVAQAYAVNQKFLDGLPQDVTEGIYTIAPSPAIESNGYKRLTKILGSGDLDPYSCQTHDQASLVILAIAKAGEATGSAIKDNIRKISQGNGQEVDNAVDGLKLLAAGKEINFTGASGPCDFTDIGDIHDCQFRYEQAEKGKFKTLRIA
jgi:ABC-type branched-subunit amino acid transport system substrate-binding protein